MIYKCTNEKFHFNYKIWDFMKWGSLAFSVSSFFLILSIIVISIKGFNWGIDFTGGIIIEFTLKQAVDNNIDRIRKLLQQTGNFKEPLLQKFGSDHDIILRLPSLHEVKEIEKINKNFINTLKKINKKNIIVKHIEFVGPSVGADLFQTSSIALLVALISILIYIGFRFEWRVATGIVIALLHDAIITMGILSILHTEIDLTIIASLLSVIGYSLNDSIVVFDRIRENFRKINCKTPYEIFNISLTQTLYRTLITSGITLMVVLMLYLFGGSALENFSLTMLIGFPIGTISSIYVASSLALKLGIKHKHFLYYKVEKEGVDHLSTII